MALRPIGSTVHRLLSLPLSSGSPWSILLRRDRGPRLRHCLREISSGAALAGSSRHQEQQQQRRAQRHLPPTPPRAGGPGSLASETLAQKIGKTVRRPGASSKAKVYADVNVVRPKDYWDYESVTIQWG